MLRFWLRQNDDRYVVDLRLGLLVGLAFRERCCYLTGNVSVVEVDFQ
jgi:hypothetical protein